MKFPFLLPAPMPFEHTMSHAADTFWFGDSQAPTRVASARMATIAATASSASGPSAATVMCWPLVIVWRPGIVYSISPHTSLWARRHISRVLSQVRMHLAAIGNLQARLGRKW